MLTVEQVRKAILSYDLGEGLICAGERVDDEYGFIVASSSNDWLDQMNCQDLPADRPCVVMNENGTRFYVQRVTASERNSDLWFVCYRVNK
jgi:hypothetical protein